MTAAKKRFLVFGLMALAILLVAVLAPVIATHDPNSSVLADAVQPPSGEHWFGTDKMGRDLFSRVIYGTRTSILSTMVLVLSILLVGGALGIVRYRFYSFHRGQLYQSHGPPERGCRFGGKHHHRQ